MPLTELAAHTDHPLEIVVVEDHDLVRDELVDFLNRPGIRVRGAEDGEVLDALLRQRHADILVVDLNLPGEDGLSLAQRLRGIQLDIGISSMRWPACCTPPKANWCSTAMSPPCCTPWRWPLTTL